MVFVYHVTDASIENVNIEFIPTISYIVFNYRQRMTREAAKQCYTSTLPQTPIELQCNAMNGIPISIDIALV